MNAPDTVPQYLQIADTLRRRIRDGVYTEGEVLPSAAELERKFAVSNITIRKALAVLADEGCVAGKRGVGTLVIGTPPESRVAIAVSDDFRTWLETASGRTLPIEQEVLEIGTLLSVPHAARVLGVDPRSPVWRMRRIRRIRGEPVSYHVNYGRPETLGRIGRGMMDDRRNFVDVLREDLKLPLVRIDQTIEAIVADRDLGERLAIGFGKPVLLVEHQYSAQDEEVIALSHVYLRGDLYAYRASLMVDEYARKSGIAGETGAV